MEILSLTFNTITIKPSPRTLQKTQIPGATLQPRLTLDVGRKQRRLAAAACVSNPPNNSVEAAAVEKEELVEKRMPEKCWETEKAAEMLECLEKEAIMGEDEGRDPKDYDRRAKIFDKSSRIFQTLKERRN